MANKLWDRIRKAGQSLTRMLRRSEAKRRREAQQTERRDRVASRAQRRASVRKRRLGHFKDVAPALDTTGQKPLREVPSRQPEATPDFTDAYNTKLSRDEEDEFQEWTQENNNQRDLEDYDLRGAWKAGNRDTEVHGPDTWKKPNHPTFSDESVYHGAAGHRGGRWGSSGGEDTFTPSDTNLQMHGRKGLEDYFQKYEPQVKLQDESDLSPQERVGQQARERADQRRQRTDHPPRLQQYEFEGETTTTSPQTGGLDVQRPGGRAEPGAGGQDTAEKLLANIREALTEQTQNIVEQLTEVIKENNGYGP